LAGFEVIIVGRFSSDHRGSAIGTLIFLWNSLTSGDSGEGEQLLQRRDAGGRIVPDTAVAQLRKLFQPTKYAFSRHP